MCEYSPTVKTPEHVVILNIAMEVAGAFRRRIKRFGCAPVVWNTSCCIWRLTENCFRPLYITTHYLDMNVDYLLISLHAFYLLGPL